MQYRDLVINFFRKPRIFLIYHSVGLLFNQKKSFRKFFNIHWLKKLRSNEQNLIFGNFVLKQFAIKLDKLYTKHVMPNIKKNAKTKNSL